VLLAVFQRRVHGLFTRPFLSALVRMAAAALVMAPAVWAASRFLEGAVGTRGLGAQLVTGLGPVALGAAVYAAVAHLLRVQEIGTIAGGVWRRLRRR
jgi:hypothetical protein